MAQTDSRAGFRLPWSSERSTAESTDAQEADFDQDTSNAWPTTDQAEPAVDEVHPTHTDAETEPAAFADADPEPPRAAPEPPRQPARKPSTFLADLTKAMQAAAEEARNASLSQFQAEAKGHVEQIHERSGEEAASLRNRADVDIEAIREWSKAEIARIREETETRITARKGRLETEIESHAAQIEREIERVHGRVGAFEQEMADFFERLLAEDDPTRFATMAERLPEPPPFESMGAETGYTGPEAVVAEEPVAEAPAEALAATETEDEPTGEAESGTLELTDADAETAGAIEPEAEPEAEAEAIVATETEGTADDAVTGSFEPNGEVPADFEIDREAAFAAIQAAAEAAASAEVATDAAARAEAVADIAIEIVGSHDDDDDRGHTDFDAAEAEAAASADAGVDGDEIPVIGDDALAARLADLLPGSGDKAGATDTQTTQVVVVGLVSVASIASFKRHLGRLPGVRSVGVSSGPDGEFLFAVHHGADVILRDAVPSLPSFQARVTGSGDGTLNVTAHDPESDS